MVPSAVLPPLDAATEAALRASIERFGVLVPVLVDQDGELLDGRNRLRVATDLGIDCPRHEVCLPADPEAAARMLADVNDARRPRLSVEQRREVVAALRAEGHSQRAIAGAVGAAQSTVNRDLHRPGVPGDSRDSRGTPESPGRAVGLDGKTYLATAEAGEQRREAVAALRAEGHSQRAIADALGVAQPTVHRDLRRPGDEARPDGESQPLTKRQQQIAEKAKYRVETLVGQCQAYASGLPSLRAEAATAVASQEEVDDWASAIAGGARALTAFSKRLKQGRRLNAIA